MQGNKNPDPVNDPMHAHSGPVLVQMMDPKKEAGPTLVQMAQAPKNLSRRQKEYCLAKVMTKYSCLTKNTILENHYLCHINGNIMRFSGSLDPWILFKLGL